MDEPKNENPTRTVEIPQTRVLTRAQVGGLMTEGDYVGGRRRGLSRLRNRPREQHRRRCIFLRKTAAFMPRARVSRTGNGRDYVAVKVNGNFPSNPKTNGLPTIQGAIALSDATNGSLLA